MTIIWLVVWLIYGAPALHPWNAWLVSGIACLVIDCVGPRAAR